MGLKLKDEPGASVQKTGSDYINRDYSKLADDILNDQNDIPESRYSSSNSYQTTKIDLDDLNMQFKKEEYKNQDNIFNELGSRRSYPKLKWFMNDDMDDGRSGASIYIGIILCAFFIILFFHRGMTSLRDVNIDTVELEATIISVEHDERFEKRGKNGRWVDEYKTTYEWVGENGEIQTNTRIYNERKFSRGDKATVTVLASNLNQEIDSKTTAKGKVVSNFCFCLGAVALLIICVIRLKKSQE